MALLLVAATMTGVMALGVNATSTMVYKQSTAGDNQGSDLSYINGIMRYTYDTDNVDILTKVESYSEFIGIGSYTVTPGNAKVYLYNTIEAKYSADSDIITRRSQSDPFTPAGNIRVTEMGLNKTPLELDENYRTQYAKTGHGLNAYSGNSLIFYTSNVW